MAYDLTLQKRLSADVLKATQKRVKFDPSRLNDIKAAITKEDIRELVREGLISAEPIKGVSRVRARKNAVQRSKGLRKGAGSREGKSTARNPSKEAWMRKVRAQRNFIKELKDKSILTSEGYRLLYRKVKGGYFRSVRHIKLYMNENNMVKSD